MSQTVLQACGFAEKTNTPKNPGSIIVEAISRDKLFCNNLEKLNDDKILENCPFGKGSIEDK